MRIGVTINAKNSLWSSGINQNAIYLASMLVKAGYEAFLLSNVEIKDSIDNIVSRGIKTTEISKSYDLHFDVIIVLGESIWKNQYNAWKKVNHNLKIVHYKCGNDFLINSENFLFDAHESIENDVKLVIENRVIPDQIWTIPQMENTNSSFYSFMSRQKDITVVPFVWNPMLTEELQAEYNYQDYDHSRQITRTAVMEPNMNMMKHALAPMIIMSNYLDNGHKMQNLHLMSTSKRKDTFAFKNILYNGNLPERISVTANQRIRTLEILSQHADLILSWQWENALNYLYLDVVWHGYPLVHNAHMCQDIGYYYEGFNLEQGAEVLHKAVSEHQNNLTYKNDMRSKVLRYTEENDQLIEDYKLLINNLVNDNFTKFKYDCQTNHVE